MRLVHVPLCPRDSVEVRGQYSMSASMPALCFNGFPIVVIKYQRTKKLKEESFFWFTAPGD